MAQPGDQGRADLGDQRTALVTFTLMPVRGRVLVAKVCAALIAGLAAIVLAVAVAAVATVAGGAGNAWANIGVDDFAKFGLLQATGVLQGLAFGLLFLNSAAAIVVYFVVPIAFSIVANLWSALKDVAPWVDLGTAQQPLFSGVNMTGEQWAQVATSTALWVRAALRPRDRAGAPRRGEVATGQTGRHGRPAHPRRPVRRPARVRPPGRATPRCRTATAARCGWRTSRPGRPTARSCCCCTASRPGRSSTAT